MQIPKPEPNPRILVIDDNAAIHEDFKKILVSRDTNKDLSDAASAFFGEETPENDETVAVELDSALQGEEGHRLVSEAIAANRPYSMAFVDMRMPPGWDGLTTIEELWKVDPNLQVVICSAYSDNTWNDISRRLGKSDRLLILKKPFDNAEVLQMVMALVEKHRLADAVALRQEELESLVDERTQKLEAAQRESDRLLDAIDSVLIGIDKDLRIRRWNHRASDLLGITTEEALSKSLTELPIRWDNPEDVLGFLQSSKAKSTSRFETTFVNSDNRSIVLGLSCYPVIDNGQCHGSLVLGTDLTDQRIVEQQLQQAQKLESVGQLAAGIAHEINTPMQYLGDNLDFVKMKFDRLIEYLQASTRLTQMAKDANLEAELADTMMAQAKKLKLEKLYTQLPEALTDSIDGVSHVSRIVRAMKELSHPGGEEKTPVEINHLLETAITISTNEWKYVAEIDTKFDSEIKDLLGLSGELSQVFLNLIVNAAHAIGDVTDCGRLGKGLITIRTCQTNEAVVVEIGDTGGGIPEKIRDRIFDPFFTTKDVGKGTGQGLSIAHSVVTQKHGGRLTFDVEEGVGTRFIIELPIANVVEGNAAAAAQDDCAVLI